MGLSHCRQILYCLSHQGSSFLLFLPRKRVITHVSNSTLAETISSPSFTGGISKLLQLQFCLNPNLSPGFSPRPPAFWSLLFKHLFLMAQTKPSPVSHTCRGLEKGWSGFDHTLPTNSAIIWIRLHIYASHRNFSSSVIFMFFRVHATYLVF